MNLSIKYCKKLRKTTSFEKLQAYPPWNSKDIVNAIARETFKAIIKDLDNGFFLILVDESRDISVKEQITLVLHYVNKKEIII